MAQRTINQVNKELNYLEVCYQRLTIKTIPYQEEKKRLLKEKEKLLKMNDQELARIEKQAKNYKESNLKGKLTDPNGGKELPHPTIISDDSEDIRL